MADNLSGDQRDAYAYLQDLFRSYGIGSLAPTILKYIQQGYSTDTIAIELQQTQAYKDRFRANETRIKNGLPALSPAEYISTERSYRSVMQAAGLPVGFFDQQSDFTRFLELDVSPTELQARVAAASDVINRAPAETVRFAHEWGYTNGDLIAYALDPRRAEPLVEQRLRAAEAAAVAANQGLALDRQTAELVGRETSTYGQIEQGVSAIANQARSTDYLSQIYGDQVTTQEVAQAVLQGDASAQEKIKKLASQERAAFAGKSAASSGQSLSKSGGGQF